jgi:hypothetical protein
MDWLVQLGQGALGIGALIILCSFVLDIKRTGDATAVLFFWQKRLQLTRQEFIINRASLGLMILGVVVRLIYHIFFIRGQPCLTQITHHLLKQNSLNSRH